MIDLIQKSSKQQTILNSIKINGVGLHSGISVMLKLEPANEDNGIKFIRSDLKKNNVIKALWSNVTATTLSTTISNTYGAKISTVEHLMSALSGLHIDNLNIYIDGSEVPIMDGSAASFVYLVHEAGVQSLPAARKFLKVSRSRLSILIFIPFKSASTNNFAFLSK